MTEPNDEPDTTHRAFVARIYLVRRLTDRHGLDHTDALNAVLQAERHQPGPHTELVRAEAHAIVTELLTPIWRRITETIEALIPAIGVAAAGLKQAADAVTQAHYALAPPPAPGRRRDRPAWQSPYGPPTRHH